MKKKEVRTRFGTISRHDKAGSKETDGSVYTQEHARSGVAPSLPAIETWPNQYENYEIKIEMPEYTSICPRTKLPDFGTITLRYLPDKLCVELKSLKYYILAYRNLGIFYENAVNRILRDVAAACKPKWAVVTGEFNTRGGMRTSVEARYGRGSWVRDGSRSSRNLGENRP